MAADLSAAVNGYGSQYSQPVELAASVPASSSQPAQAQSESSSTATTADPQQIGWYFVQQYYTTLSKHPDQIHLFYSKKSQLVTGVEAEKVVPSVGKNAIKEKIKELDIQDCKIRVLNVDSQMSLNNIVVQVIGVMSNKAAPSKKFVQTFVLTPQTNGFYVLNDIIRYLNDEEDEIIEDEHVAESIPASEPITEPVTEPLVEPAAESTETAAPAENNHESVDNEENAQQVAAKLEQVANEPSAPSTDGQSEAAAETEAKDVVSEQAEEESSLPVEHPAEPEPTPAVLSPPKAATPPPAAEVPLTKRTWANMVGTKAATAAAPAVSTPISVQPKAQKASQSTGTPKSTSSPAEPASSAPAQSSEWQTADHSKRQNRPPNRSVSDANVLGYIKNVTEKIDAAKLKQALEKFGDLKYFDVSRPRSCAFVEFSTAAGYTAAVNANPHTVGTEQIYLVERRPRPNAFGGSNSGFARGGPIGGRGRGGMGPQPRSNSQNAPGPKENGRDTFQQRGARSGNITPRGRGQPQPV